MVNCTSTTRQLLASYTAALGSWVLGMSVGWSSSNAKALIDGYFKFPISKSEYYFIIGAMPLGAAIMSIPIGLIMDTIGRKTAMLIMIPLCIVAWALLIWPQHVTMLYIGRFMTGMCSGAYSILVPVYCIEIAETHKRGLIGSSGHIFITLGILYVWIVGAVFDTFVMTILCGILPIIFGICFCFLPESPVFLLKYNKIDEAIGVMKRLRDNDAVVLSDLEQITDNLNYANSNMPICKAICLKRTTRSLSLSILLMVFQQMSGITIVTFHSYSLIQTHTSTEIVKVEIILVLGIVQMIAAFLIALRMDRWGRRVLFLSSTFSLAMCCFVFGLLYRDHEDNINNADKVSWLVLVTTAIYVITYSFGMGVIPWIFCAEIFADNIRGICMSIAATINWLIAFGILMIYMFAQSYVAYNIIFFTHSFLLLIVFFSTLMYMPETTRKTFKEIQILMEHNIQ